MKDTSIVVPTAGLSTREFYENETTDSVVITCVSFRFRPHTEMAVQETFGIGNYDLISLAGGAKSISSPGIRSRRRAVLSDIDLVIEKHKVGKIILLNHQTCSKYAAEGISFGASEREAERQFHHGELREAGRRMGLKFPNVTVLLGYMHVADGKVVIEPISA